MPESSNESLRMLFSRELCECDCDGDCLFGVTLGPDSSSSIIWSLKLMWGLRSRGGRGGRADGDGSGDSAGDGFVLEASGLAAEALASGRVWRLVLVSMDSCVDGCVGDWVVILHTGGPARLPNWHPWDARGLP